MGVTAPRPTPGVKGRPLWRWFDPTGTGSRSFAGAVRRAYDAPMWTPSRQASANLVIPRIWDRVTAPALILVMVALVGGCAGPVITLTGGQGIDAKEAPDIVYKVHVDPERDPIRGSLDAPVTLVEFADFQCPYCAEMSALLAEVVQGRQGEVRWALKHLPLPNHDLAIPAAAAVICAHEQGRAWEVHDALMSRGGDLNPDELLPLIVGALTDREAWEGCMDGQGVSDKLMADLELGMLVEVTGTPTLYVNGRRHEGLISREELDDLIDRELKSARKLLGDGVPSSQIYERITENGQIKDFLGPTTHQFTVEESHRLGPSDAPVTLTLFSDYECPYCVQAAPMLEAAKAHFGDRVSLVYKHFPLTFHPGALPAAKASICAGQQGQFWAYHHALLNLQGLSDESLEGAAQSLGLDMTAYGTCLQGTEAETHVHRDLAEAGAAGVRGTPTVFVNGRELMHPMGPQVRVLIRVIDGLLEDSGP